MVISVLVCTTSVIAVDVSSYGACLYNCDSGEFYYEYNADTQYAPASMTKIMTAYMIYEKISEGEISKDTSISISANAAQKSRDPEATNVILNEGETKTIDELLAYIMVPSACAACTAVADAIFGGEAAMAQAMTQKAQNMGWDMYFEDTSGLSDNNRMTARSAALLTDSFIKKYPDILEYTSMQSVRVGDIVYQSTNKMLPGKEFAYNGTQGFKTGTTTLAGCCFTCTTERDGIRFISVTMHSSSGNRRFMDTIEMMDYGFYAVDKWYGHIYSTEIRAFIDRNEIPAFWYNGKNKGLVVIFEDLKDYGFDIVWNEETKTVHAYISNKEPQPIPMDYYRSLGEWTEVMNINRAEKINAILHMDDTAYIFKDVYSCGGYVAVSADELGEALGKSTWNEEDKSLMIYSR